MAGGGGGRIIGRTLKELREAKGLSYESLALRINLDIERTIKDRLRSIGEDLRVARTRRVRDLAVGRLRVDAGTVARWENVGFGVENGTRAAHEFYGSIAYLALANVLEADPLNNDLDSESHNAMLRPGDAVVRPVDEESRAAPGEDANYVVRFLVVPDGYGGVFLKHGDVVTSADYDNIREHHKEETAFLDDAVEQAIYEVTSHEAADLDAELRDLLDDQQDQERL